MARKTQLANASRIALAAALFTFAAIEACFILTTRTAPPPFAGTWRLVSFVTVDDQGQSRPSPYVDGRLSYDAGGQMAAQLTYAGRPPLDPEASDADRAAAQRSYLAYYGTYEVDAAAARVTHHVEASTNPGWAKTDLVRSYEFADGNATLRLTMRDATGRTTGTLVWRRIHQP